MVKADLQPSAADPSHNLIQRYGVVREFRTLQIVDVGTSAVITKYASFVRLAISLVLLKY